MKQVDKDNNTVTIETHCYMTEKDKYQELSKIQKDFVDTLKEIGFVWKDMHRYSNPEYGVINVARYEKWSQLLLWIYNSGKDQARFSIQRAIGIGL